MKTSNNSKSDERVIFNWNDKSNESDDSSDKSDESDDNYSDDLEKIKQMIIVRVIIMNDLVMLPLEE